MKPTSACRRWPRERAAQPREAVEEKLQDMEDLYLAEEVMRLRQSEGGEDISLDELSKRLGLDD